MIYKVIGFIIAWSSVSVVLWSIFHQWKTRRWQRKDFQRCEKIIQSGEYTETGIRHYGRLLKYGRKYQENPFLDKHWQLYRQAVEELKGRDRFISGTVPGDKIINVNQ